MSAQVVRERIQSSEHFAEDDILVFSDLDEMSSREVLNNLRHCQLNADQLAVAITMPMGNLDQAFNSDFPVSGKPHSYGRATAVKVEIQIKVDNFIKILLKANYFSGSWFNLESILEVEMYPKVLMSQEEFI